MIQQLASFYYMVDVLKNGVIVAQYECTEANSIPAAVVAASKAEEVLKLMPNVQVFINPFVVPQKPIV